MSLHGAWITKVPGRSCRSMRLGGATCSTPHVARRERVERHGRRGMSLHTVGPSDTVDGLCRSGRACGATWSPRHVALDRCVKRPMRAAMSRFTSSSSDMQSLRCRTSLGSRATCLRQHVAPHTGEASPDRSRKATFALSLVTPRAWVGRHAAARSATRTRERAALARKPWTFGDRRAVHDECEAYVFRAAMTTCG